MTPREWSVFQGSSLVHEQRWAQKKSQTVLTPSITGVHYRQLRSGCVDCPHSCMESVRDGIHESMWVPCTESALRLGLFSLSHLQFLPDPSVTVSSVIASSGLTVIHFAFIWQFLLKNPALPLNCGLLTCMPISTPQRHTSSWGQQGEWSQRESGNNQNKDLERRPREDQERQHNPCSPSVLL